MKSRNIGSPSPLGATLVSPGCWNFAVYSPNIITELVIGDYDSGNIIRSFSLDPIVNRTGDIWHIAVQTDEETLLWGWRIDSRSSSQATRRAPIVVDPFAKLLKTQHLWGKNTWEALTEGDGGLIGVATSPDAFRWELSVTRRCVQSN